MLLLRLGLLYLVYRYHNATSQNESLLSVYQSYCPYNKLCSNAPLNEKASIPKEYRPCCLPCNCDAQCWKFSDCCPDVLDADTPDQFEIATCQVARYQSEKVKQTNLYYGGKQFRMVSRCPHRYDGPLYKQCDGQFEGTVELDDVVVVSDSHYPSRAYKNKYCAKCNGIEDITRWSLRSEKCNIVPNMWNLIMSEVEGFLLDHCEIASLPPPEVYFATTCLGLDVERNVCAYKPNVSGPVMVEACSSSFGPMHPDFDVTSNNYFLMRKNVYCYSCYYNDPGTTKKTLCRRSQMDPLLSRSKSYSLFLDLKTDTLREEEGLFKDESDEFPICKNGELYDHVTKECRILRCPLFSGARQSTCVPFGSVAPGIQYVIPIVLKVDYPNTLPERIATEDVKFIEGSLMERTKLYRCSLVVFSIHMYRERLTNMVPFLTVVLRSSISETCTYEHIIRNIHMSMAKPWTQHIYIGKQFVQVLGKINLFKTSYETRGYDESMYSHTPAYLKPIEITRRQSLKIAMFSCPYFVLNASEYDNVLRNIIGMQPSQPDLSGNFTMMTILHDGFHAISEDKVAVCTDTLFGFENTATCLHRHILHRIQVFVLVCLLKGVM